MDCLWSKEARQGTGPAHDDGQEIRETSFTRKETTKHVDFDFDEARDPWWIRPPEANSAIANRPSTPYAEETERLGVNRLEMERPSGRRGTISLKPSSRPLRPAPSPNRYEAYEARKDPMDILSQPEMPDTPFLRPMAPKHMHTTCFTSEITGQAAAEIIADRAGHSNARLPPTPVSTTTRKVTMEPAKPPVPAPFSRASIKESRTLKQELNDAYTSPARKVAIEERILQKACSIREHFKMERMSCQPQHLESSDPARHVPSNATISPARSTPEEAALFHQKSQIELLDSVQQGKDAGQTGRKSYTQRLRESLVAQASFQNSDDQVQTSVRSRNHDIGAPVVASPTPIKPGPPLGFTPVEPATPKQTAVNAGSHESKGARAQRNEKFGTLPRTLEARSEEQVFAEAFGRRLESTLLRTLSKDNCEGLQDQLKKTDAWQQSPAADRTHIIEDLPLRPKNTLVSSHPSSLPMETPSNGELKDPAQTPPTVLSPAERRYRDRGILFKYLRNKIPESRDGLARLTGNKSFAEIEKIEDEILAHFEKTAPGLMEKLRAWEKRETTEWRMNKWVKDNPELRKSAGGQSKGEEKDGRTEHGASANMKVQLEEAVKPKVQEKDNRSEKVHIEDVGRSTVSPHTLARPGNPVMPYRSSREPPSSEADFSRPSAPVQRARSIVCRPTLFDVLPKLSTPEATSPRTPPTPVKATTPITTPDHLEIHPCLSDSMRRTLEPQSRGTLELRKANDERLNQVENRLAEVKRMLADHAEEKRRQKERGARVWAEDAHAWEGEQRQEKERIKQMGKQHEDKVTTPMSATRSKITVSTSSPSQKTTLRFDTPDLGTSVEAIPAPRAPTPITMPPMLRQRERLTRSPSDSLYVNVNEPLRTTSPSTFESIPLSAAPPSTPSDSDWDKIEDLSSTAAADGWELLEPPTPPRRFFNWMHWKS